jgi:hypothetical protein
MKAVGRRSTLRLAVIAAALVAGGMAAGCGDNSKSDGAAAGTTSSKQTFTGDPVTIYVQGALKTPVTDLSDAAAAVRLQAKKINDEGGLGGHEVVIKTCNDTDANAEMQCVRKATAEKALAFVGSSFIFNPQPAQEALAKASTASVAPLAIQQVEYSSPINFPLYSPSFGILTCPQQMVDGAGSQKVAAITQDLPVQKDLLKTIGGLAQIEGTPFGAGVAVPQTQTDFSSAVRQLADSRHRGQHPRAADATAVLRGDLVSRSEVQVLRVAFVVHPADPQADRGDLGRSLRVHQPAARR